MTPGLSGVSEVHCRWRDHALSDHWTIEQGGGTDVSRFADDFLRLHSSRVQEGLDGGQYETVCTDANEVNPITVGLYLSLIHI